MYHRKASKICVLVCALTAKRNINFSYFRQIFSISILIHPLLHSKNLHNHLPIQCSTESNCCFCFVLNDASDTGHIHNDMYVCTLKWVCVKKQEEEEANGAMFFLRVVLSMCEFRMRNMWENVKAYKKSTHQILLRALRKRRREEKGNETIGTQTQSQTVRPANWILCFHFRWFSFWNISTTPKMSFYLFLVVDCRNKNQLHSARLLCRSTMS